jgi:type IV pilus assembly protein PilY1
MKSIKPLLLIIPFLLLLFNGTSFAHDTDLYTASGAGVEPNILIMFDNSGSMNGTVLAYYYDPSILYDPLVVPQANRDTVYYQQSWGRWTLFKNGILEVPCAIARNALTNKGNYQGNTNLSCNGGYKTLRTGNYRNYLASVGGSEYKTKLEIAKTVIKNFLDTINGVRVGVMVFNESEGGHMQSFITTLTDATRTQLKADIDAITANTWTPLGETLYEAGLYFKGGASYFNSGVNYTSPIQYHCQRNYVVIITDGESTQDRNDILKTAIGDRDGDQREPGMVNDPHYADSGTDYLDDVAKFLYETDRRSDLTGQQNIITYTIGFTISSSLLERTATHGHGRYFYSQNAQELSNAFQNIVGEILAKSTSFVAPIVPVSRLERTTAGDKIYLAFFKPVSNGIWSGNIKKYGVQQVDNPSAGLHAGDIIDVNGLKALDDNGQFYSTARSFWTISAMDGGEVEQGGVGEVIMNRLNQRNIYTYFYTNVNLTNSSNAFTTDNLSITPTVLGLLEGDTTGRYKLIRFVRGWDAYDDNGNGILDEERRDWILGSFLHSRPVIIHYTTTPARSVVFGGSNDGMLHAFDDSDGRELWTFIPPNFLNKLQALHSDVNEMYVDGSPRVYLSYDADGNLTKAILIFGQRRGGDHYCALDVTNPDAPKFLWEIGPTARVFETTTYPTADYQELGQTWSSPIVGKIAYGEGEKWVAFIGGGYDTNQDNDPVIASDQRGRAIYVVDVLNGSLVKRFSNAEISDMTYSIPSDIAKVDTDGNGKVDRLYVGDTGGRIWRFDIGNSDVNQWTAKIIFKSNPDTSDRRKIFYPPDVTLEKDTINYEMLYFGTGDREAPKESAVINRIYAVKDKNLVDKNPPTPYVENDLVDVTSDILQDPTKTQTQKNDVLNQLKEKNGWYIILENTSEKSLATPVVFYKTAYFTTFTASSDTYVGDPCYVGEGTARLYALKYNSGNAIFNLDLTNDVGGTVISKTDRSLIMGTAIPSGVIITFIGGTAVAYAGVGGGVYSPQLGSTSPLVPMTWRIVF